VTQPCGFMARCVATAVAMVVAVRLSWGHTFPPVRTVVAQVERCELAVLVGYRPASGEATDTVLARIASQPKSQMLVTAKHVLAKQALAPLSFTVDGKPLVPTSVRAKIGVDPGGTRPIAILLVTFAIPTAGTLAISSQDARSTRISWTDRSSHRVDYEQAPAQGRWFTGVASFLLSLGPPKGDSACVRSRRSLP
jgi:hypothetical protein